MCRTHNTSQVAQLSSLVSAHAVAKQEGKGSNLVVLAGGLGVVALLHVRGTLSDYLYVTRAQFRHGVSTLGSGITALSSALARAKAALAEKLEALSGRVDDVAASQAAIAEEVAGARSDIDELNQAIASLSAKQDVGNRGIFMLCTAVSSLFKQSGAPELPQHKQGLAELQAILQASASAPLIRSFTTVEDQLASISQLARAIDGA